MDTAFVHKGLIGAVGMAIGAALITVIRIAAVDGAENARLRHLADVASGRAPAARVALRADALCPSVAGGELPQSD